MLEFPILEPISTRPEHGETPSPHELAIEQNEVASVGYVQHYVSHYINSCPELRVLRRWSVIACVLLGVMISLSVIGWISAKSLFRDAVRAELKDMVDRQLQDAIKTMGRFHVQLEEIQEITEITR